MKTKIGIVTLILWIGIGNLQAQQRITAKAASYDISDNLDLQAVADIFGQSENLQDFEQRLNDPKTQISNLDLNQDGYVDYLRVVEDSQNGNHEVVIQAVLGDNEFQDVATIDVNRDNNNPQVVVIGNDYLYGQDYYFEPVYVTRPLIFSFFWGAAYRPWRSPYYWGYYPSYYHHWRPFSPFRYQRNIYARINYGNSYHFNNVRHDNHSTREFNSIRRNDFAQRHPDRAFTQRNQGYKNKAEIVQRRPSNASRSEIRRENNQIQPQRQNNNQVRRDRPSSVNSSPQQNRRETRPAVAPRQSNESNKTVRPSNRIESPRRAPVSTQKAAAPSNRERSVRIKSSQPEKQNVNTRSTRKERKVEKRRKTE